MLSLTEKMKKKKNAAGKKPKTKDRKVISCTTLISFKLRIIEVRALEVDRWSILEQKRVVRTLQMFSEVRCTAPPSLPPHAR